MSECINGDTNHTGPSYATLGHDEYLLDIDQEIIDLHGHRIKKLENLEQCPKLVELKILTSRIEKIENLGHLHDLEKLDLYQNCIHKIENLSSLRGLRVLDLSFNKIRIIENLESQSKLEKLYLSSNRINTIQNLSKLTSLKILELGSNRIRVIEGLDNLDMLQELWLGKNKITDLTIRPFPNLTKLSLQSNRLTDWSLSLFEIGTLEELYLSNNNLCNPPPEISKLKNLKCLDIASNKLTSLQSVNNLPDLMELWVNDNDISEYKEIESLKSLTNLETIYLEGNPLKTSLGPAYRSTIQNLIPSLTQLDATPIVSSVIVHVEQSNVPSVLRR